MLVVRDGDVRDTAYGVKRLSHTTTSSHNPHPPHGSAMAYQATTGIAACVCLLIVLLLLRPASSSSATSAGLQAGGGEQICSSTYISTSVSAFDKLRDCRVIEGNLRIVLFDHTVPSDFVNLTFPNLVEITDYLVVFRVSGLQSIGKLFPNLAVIRGQELFHDYALVIYQMNSLTELDLQHLTSIERGAVRIQKNPNLCYADTINWDLIATSSKSSKRAHETSENKAKKDCPKCRSSCPVGPSGPLGLRQHLCWGSDKCQRVCNESLCKTRSCYQNDTNLCCHASCIGGCTGPTAADCIACRGVLHDNTCMKSCPADGAGIKYLEFNERRCITVNECYAKTWFNTNTSKQEVYKSVGTGEEPGNPKKTGKCLKKCPADYEVFTNDPMVCKRCSNGKCPVFCTGGMITNVQQAQRYKGCTKVTSGIEINLIKSSGSASIVTELEQNLQDIEEIDGHLKISRSYPLVSLHFFKKLTKITGSSLSELTRQDYSFTVQDNANMKELFDWKARNYTKLTIVKGKFFIHMNPKLCMKKILELKNYTNIQEWNDHDVSPSTNGDREACEIIDMKVRAKPGSKSIMVSWMNVKSLLHDPRSLIGYYILYRPAKHNISKYDGRDACSVKNDVWQTGELISYLDSVEQTQLLTMLKPATRYAIYIQAHMVSTANKGGESEVIYVETNPDTPSEPIIISGEAINDTAIAIRWKKPKRPNGNVTHYIIHLQPVPRMKEQEKDYCAYDIAPFSSSQESKPAVTTASPLPQLPSTTMSSSIPSSPMTAGSILMGKSLSKEEEQCCKACTVHDVDDDAQEEISFENYMHDAIYIKKTATSSPVKNKVRRSIEKDETVTGRYSAEMNQIDPLVDSFTESLITSSTLAASATYTTAFTPVPTISSSSSNSTAQPSSSSPSSPVPSSAAPSLSSKSAAVTENSTQNKMPGETVDNSFTVNVTATNMEFETVVIPNLLHFYNYDVNIIACQALWEDPQSKKIKKLCSDSKNSLITIQTSARSSADEVHKISVSVDSTNSSSIEVVRVNWNAPPNPNGDIVSYSVRLHRAGTKDPEIKCVNESEFLKYGQGWMSADLPPGDYNIRVRANSLAGHGNWSAEEKFTVTDLSAMSWKKIVLISFLVFVLFVLSTGVISLYVFKKARLNVPSHLEYVSMNPEYMPAYEPDEWELLRDDITLIREVGEGSFGKVHEGILRNTVTGVAEQPCAVKTVNDRATAREKVEFLQEASIMKAFNCHHVVKLLGVVSTGSPVFVCMELMPMGDLKNYLRRCRDDGEGGREFPLPSKALVHLMSCQIADGMAYLGAKKYVHRDLAGRNCMLAQDLTVKIGDFGMTRDVYETDYYRRGGQGKVPVRWMAPECVRDGIFSSQSDVWSFGVVLWEIVTLGEQPYQGYSNEKVVAFVKGGGNPGKPENCPEDLFSVMSLCWSWHQKARPTFGEVIDSLLPEIEDTEMGTRFKKYSYYIDEKNSCTVVNVDDQLESTPLTEGSKDGSGGSGTGGDGKAKYMPSVVDVPDDFLRNDATGDEAETSLKTSGTNTMSIRSAAMSTMTENTTLTVDDDSQPGTRHNSNDTTGSPMTEEPALVGVGVAVVQLQENDDNSNTTRNQNVRNLNTPSPLIPNGYPPGLNHSSSKSNGLNGSADNSKGSDGSKGSIISNGAPHDEYRGVRASIL